MRFVWLVVIVGGLTACENEEVRGVLVAKFLDGSARFIKRITISTVDGPALSLTLVAKSKRCELVAPVPAGALSASATARTFRELPHCDVKAKRTSQPAGK